MLCKVNEDGSLSEVASNGGGLINDEKTSENETWSSKKINDSLVDIKDDLIPKDITSQCVLADGITTLALDVYIIGKQVYINGLFEKAGGFAVCSWKPLLTLPNGITSGKNYSEQGCGGSAAYSGAYGDIEAIASSLHQNALCIYKGTTTTKSTIAINRIFKIQ